MRQKKGYWEPWLQSLDIFIIRINYGTLAGKVSTKNGMFTHYLMSCLTNYCTIWIKDYKLYRKGF